MEPRFHGQGVSFRNGHVIRRLLLSTVNSLWLPARGRSLAVLAFHRVLPCRDELLPGVPDGGDFAALMDVVAESFHCLDLAEGLERLAAGHRLPPRSVAITFDDGYADNHTLALPILRSRGLTATFFITSGCLDGGCLWNDEAVEHVRAWAREAMDLTDLDLGLGEMPCRTGQERLALAESLQTALKYRTPTERRQALDRLSALVGRLPPRNLMLTTSQVVEMHQAGMGIGGHTLSHPILATIEDRLAWQEIGEDRERLAAIIGGPPRLFAYPNGKPGADFDRRHAAMARAVGYRGAVTTVWGAAGPGADLFQIPRFTPWDRQPWRFALRLTHNYSRCHFQLA